LAYKYKGTGFYTHLSQDQVTVDLPVSGGTPAEIDLSGASVVIASIYIADAFYWTMADTAANALTRIAADATRCKWPAGFYTFDCSGTEDLNLYIEHQTGGPTTDAISYALSEGD